MLVLGHLKKLFFSIRIELRVKVTTQNVLVLQKVFQLRSGGLQVFVKMDYEEFMTTQGIQ